MGVVMGVAVQMPFSQVVVTHSEVMVTAFQPAVEADSVQFSPSLLGKYVHWASVPVQPFTLHSLE